MQTKLIGGLASIPEREATLERVVASIANQLDILYVYLNNYKNIPAFFKKYPHVRPLLSSQERGDLNANGKMYFLEYENEGIAFTLDDDIVYPKNYVDKFIEVFDTFKMPVMVCVHGSVFPQKVNYYYERSITFVSKSKQQYNNIVSLGGSGTMAFPVNVVKNNTHDFFSEVYVDLQLSLLAHQCRMPLISINRPEKWIKFLRYEGLWEITRSRISHHTYILQKHSHLVAWPYIRSIWNDHIDSLKAQGVLNPYNVLNLGPASIDFLEGGEFYDDTLALILLSKLSELSDNLHGTF